MHDAVVNQLTAIAEKFDREHARIAHIAGPVDRAGDALDTLGDMIHEILQMRNVLQHL